MRRAVLLRTLYLQLDGWATTLEEWASRLRVWGSRVLELAHRQERTR